MKAVRKEVESSAFKQTLTQILRKELEQVAHDTVRKAVRGVKSDLEELIQREARAALPAVAEEVIRDAMKQLTVYVEY